MGRMAKTQYVCFLMVLLLFSSQSRANDYDDLVNNQPSYEINQDFLKQARNNSMKIHTNSDWFKKLNSFNPLNHLKKPETNHLLVLVSFSMPQTSLNNLYKEVKKYKGKLIMRGFYKNSLKETSLHMVKLHQNKIDFSYNINPRYFRMFNVNQVPAFVLVDEFEQCYDNNCMLNPPKKYDIVYGNIHVKSALETIRNYGDLSGLANRYLLTIN